MAKHKQGHNFPIELSLGEIPHEQDDNLSFVAVFRPSIEDSMSKVNTSSEIDTNLSDTSPVSIDSKEDSFKINSVTSSISSFALDHDIEQALHSNRDKLDQRLSILMKGMKNVVDTEFSALESKFLVLQQKVDVLEQENEKLFQQTEKQHEHIKLLEEELGVLQKNGDKFSLVQLLKNDSTCKSFLEYCAKNNTTDLVMLYKEAEEYRSKYSQIDRVVVIKSLWRVLLLILQLIHYQRRLMSTSSSIAY